MELLERDERKQKSNSDEFVEAGLPFNQGIEFRGVWFRYGDADSWILRDVSFKINKGDTVGIMGTTGGGKSTLLDLIMGFLEPTKGSILVDGHELNTSTRRGWHEKVSHVPQSIFLIEGTVAQNVAFGNAHTDTDASLIDSALAMAHLKELQGANRESFIGENGIHLSGGQRQRIALARAYYKGAEILVLDEATSALDEKTELSVMKSIREEVADLTLIKVAHRLNTLEGFDQIYSLESGALTAVEQTILPNTD